MTQQKWGAVMVYVALIAALFLAPPAAPLILFILMMTLIARAISYFLGFTGQQQAGESTAEHSKDEDQEREGGGVSRFPIGLVIVAFVFLMLGLVCADPLLWLFSYVLMPK